MNKIKELSPKEQKVLTMFVVKGCLEYAEQNEKAFEDVLNEDLFPSEASQVFSDMICYNIKLLVDSGYLGGEVELEYDELEPGEDAADGICVPFSTFADISITEKGNVLLKSGEFGVKAKEFKEKAIPLLKHIGNVALEAVVETLVVNALHAVGV
ncbi:MAG: hypothetical protein IJX86_12970 [Lachnospiraceae bacterium]|nr:hypothetical protein [Lachnospiraceae bacterium]